ncbi:hypothetical protein [Microbacterium sp. UFMG61]|uniref:hypothetical protein n=1 Tax=Microbacterium sp. UFMG61 TaxID=2745935 RepID=UPI00188EF7B3|nr:hypothetical protein [Microbacterium sp. UFMG61]
MVSTAESRSLDADQAVDLDELAGLDRGRQRCECDHGDDEAYAACGRKAKWRVSIDCDCGENHPRTVEILCSRCLRTLRQTQDQDSITARPL